MNNKKNNNNNNNNTIIVIIMYMRDWRLIRKRIYWPLIIRDYSQL
jgi:hypothetical protein